MEMALPAVKSALHRGRTRLRDLAREPEDHAFPEYSTAQRDLLERYIDRFNARDFDAVRDMLAEEVRLDLVNKTQLRGKTNVATYVHNYSSVDDWRFSIGMVEDRTAIIVRYPKSDGDAPVYFVLLNWSGPKVVNIRDFRYARYVMDDAAIRHIVPL